LSGEYENGNMVWPEESTNKLQYLIHSSKYIEGKYIFLYFPAFPAIFMPFPRLFRTPNFRVFGKHPGFLGWGIL